MCHGRETLKWRRLGRPRATAAREQGNRFPCRWPAGPMRACCWVALRAAAAACDRFMPHHPETYRIVCNALPDPSLLLDFTAADRASACRGWSDLGFRIGSMLQGDAAVAVAATASLVSVDKDDTIVWRSNDDRGSCHVEPQHASAHASRGRRAGSAITIVVHERSAMARARDSHDARRHVSVGGRWSHIFFIRAWNHSAACAGRGAMERRENRQRRRREAASRDRRAPGRSQGESVVTPLGAL